MKIIFDDVKKEGVLIKNDGTEVSRYSYKNVFKTDRPALSRLKKCRCIRFFGSRR